MRIGKDGTQVAELKNGAFFGEQALITSEPRNADVIAKGECMVFEMAQRNFVLVKGKIKEAMAEEQRRRDARQSLVWGRQKIVEALKKVPLFADFNNSTLLLIEMWLVRRTFQDGEYLITQGDIGTTFYLARATS